MRISDLREINKFIVFFLIAALSVVNQLFVLPAEAEQEIFTVYYPPDKIVMEFDILGISLGVPEGSVDLIRVNVNNKEVANINPDQEYECLSVPLETGINTIEFIAMKGDRVVDCVIREVFRRSDLISKYMDAPPDFKKDYFHMEEHLQCTKCHALKPGVYDKKPIGPAAFSAETFDSQTVIAAGSTCYSCHNKIASYPYVHDPAFVWSCLSCHDPQTEPKYSVKKPAAEICFNCHIEQKKDWSAKKFIHGPVNTGKCAICHSPHASDNPFNLFKPTWDLCVSCHFEKGNGRHVLGESFSTEGHPTRGRQDPIKIGKELTCVGCHNPHASNSPHLWALNVQSFLELCKKCHYDK